MNLNSIWSALEEGFEPINEDSYSVWLKIASEQGFESGWISWLAAQFVFGTEPFTTKEFMLLFPYGSARVLDGRFESAVKHGIMTIESENTYRATENGVAWKNHMIQNAIASVEHLQPISSGDMQKILGYCKRLVETSLAAPEPPSHFGASHYFKNMYPSDDSLPIRMFVHYFGTLDKYRGNAHLATWKHFGIEGNRWEVFSEVWLGKFNTLDKLYDELKSRGITRDEYDQILQELLERGWVEENAGEYQLTVEGRQIREEAEALTNRYFFAPWSCLNESELEELLSLAIQLRDGLSSLKEKL